MRKKLLVLALLITLTASYKEKTKAASNFDPTKELRSYQEAAEIVNWNPIIDPLTAIVGTDVKFSISYIGIPEPTYKVKKNGLDFTSSSRCTITKVNNKVTVFIKTVTPADAGIYTIIVTNKLGEDSAFFTLITKTIE